MVTPESRSCSEMLAATELPISERPTLSSVPSAPPVALADDSEEPPRSERISQLEARVGRLLDENRALLLSDLAFLLPLVHRIERANECLQHARDARIAIKAYVDACEKIANEGQGVDRVALALAADEAYAALVALVAKPL